MGRKNSLFMLAVLFLAVLSTVTSAEAFSLFRKKKSNQSENLSNKTSQSQDDFSTGIKQKAVIHVDGQNLIDEDMLKRLREPFGPNKPAVFRLRIEGDPTASFRTEIINVGTNKPRDQKMNIDRGFWGHGFTGNDSEAQKALRTELKIRAYALRVDTMGSVRVDHGQVEEFVFESPARWLVSPIEEVLEDDNLYIFKHNIPDLIGKYIVTNKEITGSDRVAYIMLSHKLSTDIRMNRPKRPSYYPSQERIDRYYAENSVRFACLKTMYFEFLATGGQKSDIQGNGAPTSTQEAVSRSSSAPAPSAEAPAPAGLQTASNARAANGRPLVLSETPVPYQNSAMDVAMLNQLASEVQQSKAPPPQAAPAAAPLGGFNTSKTSGLPDPSEF